MYVDQKYNVLLTEEQKELSQIQLLELRRKIQKVSFTVCVALIVGKKKIPSEIVVVMEKLTLTLYIL